MNKRPQYLYELRKDLENENVKFIQLRWKLITVLLKFAIRIDPDMTIARMRNFTSVPLYKDERKYNYDN